MDTINGFPVIAKIQFLVGMDDLSPGTTEVVVAIRPDWPYEDKFCVWERNVGADRGWWGFYTTTYALAVENMLMRTGFNELLDTTPEQRQD